MPAKSNLITRNIDTIKATLLRPATTSHFAVEIGLPGAPTASTTITEKGAKLHNQLKGLLGGTSQDRLNLMCCETVLPGSQLATTEVFNDYTGVTERHAYRRIYDETIDLSFYVDAGNYIPIRFFETWISGIVEEDQTEAVNPHYSYRVNYPSNYTNSGLKVIKFEKTGNSSRNSRSRNQTYAGGSLQYTFVKSYPRSITSMPVTYDGSQLLKCSVQMTYMRYVINYSPGSEGGNSFSGGGMSNPFDQANFNLNGFLSRTAANLVDQVVDDISGSDFVGDIAGGFAGQWATQTLSNTGIGILQR